MNNFVICVIGAAFICCNSAASADCKQINLNVPIEEWSHKRLAYRARAGFTWSQFWESLERSYYDLDPEAKGINSKTYERRHQMNVASWRSEMIGKRLRMDLDNDGALSRDEVTAFLAYKANARKYPNENGLFYPSPAERQAKLDKLVLIEMKDDLDGDGIISGQEIRMAADASAKVLKYHLSFDCFPFSLDVDGDGAISLEELRAASLRTFRAVDVDKNDQLSDEEVKLLKH